MTAPQATRTEHGFNLGAAEVTALGSDGNGRVWIGVKTPKGAIQVYVTRTGKITVYHRGQTKQVFP